MLISTVGPTDLERIMNIRRASSRVDVICIGKPFQNLKIAPHMRLSIIPHHNEDAAYLSTRY